MWDSHESRGDGGSEDDEDDKGEDDGPERGVIRRIQVVWSLPERRGKGSEERRREMR